jgi:hypothetical protein
VSIFSYSPSAWRGSDSSFLLQRTSFVQGFVVHNYFLDRTQRRCVRCFYASSRSQCFGIAIIHYSPDPNDCAIIRKDQIYLCDSGGSLAFCSSALHVHRWLLGQYLDGTTDVTRTLHFGTPTSEQRRCFTRVLQGHIAIDTAVFPNGTTGK